MTNLPTYPLSEEGVTDALSALGNDPDIIAATLRANGLKGIPDDESRCVVAAYCIEVLRDGEGRAELEDVYAWQGGVWVEWSWRDPNGLDTERDHFDWRPSPAFAAFIERFDKREYPELIDSTEEEVSHG